MSFTEDDIQKLALLARLDFSKPQADTLSRELNRFFTLVEVMQNTATEGVEPLEHPAALVQPLSIPLQQDTVTERPDRLSTMQNAPMQDRGLFLVPRVIE